MSKRRFLPLISVSAIFLVAANTGPDVKDLLQRGNAAFGRQDYAAALAHYEKGEATATDPGQVAFNEAAALYKLGRYRLAERHYRCALEDAPDRRRTLARYCLANCLVRQGDELGAKALQEAIDLYELCLTATDLDPDLAKDVRHNLELAKLLLLEAKARPTDRPSDDEGDQPKPPSTDSSNQRPQPGDTEPGSGRPDPHGDRVPVKPEPGKQPGPGDQQPAPGKGNLQPIPDTAELSPLSPEDAAAHLRDAATRIARERNEHRRQGVKPVAPGVKDW
jgi:tetratricopeptide (TPR) repeat protein